MHQAVVARLKSSIEPILGVGVAGFSFNDDGRVSQPFQGLIYFAVHGGDIQANNPDASYYLDEMYNFKVTISVKLARVPRYKWGDIVVTDLNTGMNKLSDLVKRSLHCYIPLSDEATTLARGEDSTAQAFINGDPPRFKSASTPQDRNGEWFGSSMDSGTSGMGMSQTLDFRGLRLIRLIDNIQL